MAGPPVLPSPQLNVAAQTSGFLHRGKLTRATARWSERNRLVWQGMATVPAGGPPVAGSEKPSQTQSPGVSSGVGSDPLPRSGMSVGSVGSAVLIASPILTKSPVGGTISIEAGS